MIKKITINNIASFKQEQSLETDKKVNLIYGLNGVGKTTISNYLQDLDNQKFSNCSIQGFNSDDQKILVYNQKFIQKVFYDDDTQKGIFTLGEDNKDAKQNIKQAESAIADLNSKLDDGQNKGLTFDFKNKNTDINKNKNQSQDKIWGIKGQYTGGDRVFDAAGFLNGLKSNKEQLFNHILSLELSEPQRDINEIKKELQELGDGVEQRTTLDTINANPFSAIENNNIFSQVIVGNENSSVSELINELKNSDWVKAGLDKYVDLDKRKTCPFCQQDTLEITLINDIKKYFDVTYEKKQQELIAFKNEYTELKDNLNLKYYQKDFYTKEQNLELEKLFNAIIEILNKNIGLIENKLQNLSQSTQILSSKDCIDKLNNFITTINDGIKAFNTKLNDKNKTIQGLKNEFWKIQRKEYDQTISNYIETEKDLNAEKQEIQKQINTINEDIKDQKQIISTNQLKVSNIEKTIEKINAHLLDFGISDFKIVLHKKEEKTYKLQRGDNSEDIFKTLSEGEKTVISFLYFVELCIGEENPEEVKEKIVVIDDPISSLSHIYVFNVAELLKKYFIGKNAKFAQCFVLTHNLYFFRELINRKSFYTKTNVSDNNQKLFRIKKNEYSVIVDMNLDEVKTEYQSYWMIVRDDASKNENKFIVANAMRNIIEYFFGFMEKKNKINEIFDKKEFQDKNTFEAFRRYIERESHSEIENIYDFKDFDLQKFQEAFEKLFKETGYEEHYNKMMS